MKSYSIPIVLALAGMFLITSTLEAQRNGRRGDRRGNRGGRADTNALKVGEMAPNFVLKSLDGESETDLESFRGQKPVVLFFGSYT